MPLPFDAYSRKGRVMQQMIIVDAAEEVAFRKGAHAFALSEGISRQAIDRHAEDFDRTFADGARKVEAELALEARRRAEREAAREISSLKDAVASAQAEAQSHKAQIEKAREQAAAAAREQFELELKASKEALTAKESALAHFREDELKLRPQVATRRCSEEPGTRIPAQAGPGKEAHPGRRRPVRVRRRRLRAQGVAAP